MRIYFVTLLICSYSHLAVSQNIESLSLQLEGTDMVISFDLKPVRSTGELYDITIVSSMDGYKNAISLKQGRDKEVSPGSKLTFVIDGISEFKGFKGDLDFKVIADLAFAPIRLLTENITAKRGRMVDLRWEGGYRNESYNVELFKNETRISSLASGVTTTSTLWVVPEDNPVGSGYILKISSGTDPSKNVLSPAFSIKRKVPLGLKILPILIGGGVGGAAAAGLFGGGEADPGGGGGNTIDDLPGPPDTP
ncbi:MAG: hypothetical protein O2887_05995 [Bacteroidetes bacterium]|nr:hypothetical protein [Bacteroidota bacterium]MDA1120033.1 hypothetical protein [Bacteroidota bacterium]